MSDDTNFVVPPYDTKRTLWPALADVIADIFPWGGGNSQPVTTRIYTGSKTKTIETPEGVKFDVEINSIYEWDGKELKRIIK